MNNLSGSLYLSAVFDDAKINNQKKIFIFMNKQKCNDDRLPKIVYEKR